MSVDAETLPDSYCQHSWPENLFSEMYEMAILSFMIYTTGYILDAARKHSEDFVGLTLDENNKTIAKSQLPEDQSDLKRSFTAEELKQLVQDNIEILSKYKPDIFTGKSVDEFFQYMDIFTEKAAASTDDRPLALEEFDDKFQHTEPVYALTRDAINKRITVVFRGTDSLAFFSNWKSNMSILQKKGKIPDSLKDKLGENSNLAFHSGFYNYLYDKTEDESDDDEQTKFGQIRKELGALLAKNPGYKVYVTGHSLGAALSTICAFYLSCDPDIPKPVTNINFASPRVGNQAFLEAVQFLERTAQLRILRSVNENDSVAVAPSTNYRHVGFQVKTYAPWFFSKTSVRRPDITYPKVNQGFFADLAMAFDNSIVTSLNIGYDHGAYIERMLLAKESLECHSLNQLYSVEDMVGFKLKSLDASSK